MSDEIIRELLIKGVLEIQEWFPRRYEYPLQSIFSQVTLSKKYQLVSGTDLPPAYLSDNIVYPGRKNPQDVEKIWPQKTWNEITTLDSQKLKKIGVNRLLFLLEKFGSFAPTKNGDSTISIYDYYKLTAAQKAILHALSSEDSNRKPYLLIGGDLSGIQNFLYTITSQNALKTLRARSFFLEILNEHLVDRVLVLAKLTRVNLIYSGGGVFYVLAPNIPTIKQELNNFKRDFNKWLYDEFGTKLFLAVTRIEISQESLLNNITQSWEEISQALFTEKQHKFSDLIKSKDFFNLGKAEPTFEECDICHRDDLGKSELKRASDGYRCDFCENTVRIGSELAQIRFVYRSQNKPANGSYFSIENVFYGMPRECKKLPQEHSGIWWIFSDAQKIDELNDLNAIPLYISTHRRLMKDIPSYLKSEKEKQYKGLQDKFEREDNSERKDVLKEEITALRDDSTASFEWLAKCSSGIEQIGALRMDVDNLGKLFSRGLPEKSSIFHLSALSRNFTYFFKIYINSICCGNLNTIKPCNFLNKEINTQTGRDISVIYSGGDDLFLIGAWSEVAELSIDLGKAFKQFVGYHPDITLSGGTTVHYPKFPLYQIASLSEKALKEAKWNIEPCSMSMCHENWRRCSLKDGGLCMRKDSLSLFYTPELAAEAKSLKERADVKSSSDKLRIKIALKWKELEEYVLKQVKLFSDLDRYALKHKDRKSSEKVVLEIDRKILPRGFIFKLLELIQIWQIEGKLYLPRMAWIMGKIQSGLKKKVPRTTDYYEKFMERIHHFHLLKMASLHIPLTWVEFLMRGGKGND
ncbi:hypothetical protein ES703_54479 [subsurface metagenome]